MRQPRISSSLSRRVMDKRQGTILNIVLWPRSRAVHDNRFLPFVPHAGSQNTVAVMQNLFSNRHAVGIQSPCNIHRPNRTTRSVDFSCAPRDVNVSECIPANTPRRGQSCFPGYSLASSASVYQTSARHHRRSNPLLYLLSKNSSVYHLPFSVTSRPGCS